MTAKSKTEKEGSEYLGRNDAVAELLRPGLKALLKVAEAIWVSAVEHQMNPLSFASHSGIVNVPSPLFST